MNREDLLRTSEAKSHRREGEAGYALVFALIAIIVVSIIATAGYTLSTVELEASRDFQTSTSAFYMADRGLNKYLAEDAPDLLAADTANDIQPVTYSFPSTSGQATVTAERLAWGMERDERMYRISSTGSYTSPDGNTRQRTVSAVVIATPLSPVMPNGSYVANTGLSQSGKSATFTGIDQYSPGDNSACDVANVSGSVPGVTAQWFGKKKGKKGKGKNKNKSKNNKGGPNKPCDTDYKGATGSPSSVECRDDAAGEVMTASRWRRLKQLEANYIVGSGDQFPSTNINDSNGWDVVKIADPDYRLGGGHRGEGLLIAEGDVTMNGSFTWDGLILAGGHLRGNGTKTIHGAVVSGLNELLGQDVEPDESNGTKEIYYNSCKVHMASTGMVTVHRVPGSLYEED